MVGAEGLSSARGKLRTINGRGGGLVLRPGGNSALSMVGAEGLSSAQGENAALSMVGAEGFEPPAPCSQSKNESFSTPFTTTHRITKVLDTIHISCDYLMQDIAPYFTVARCFFVPHFVPRFPERSEINDTYR